MTTLEINELLWNRHGLVLGRVRQAQFDVLVEKLNEGFRLCEIGAWGQKNGPRCFYLRKGGRWSRNPANHCWINTDGTNV